MMSWLENLSWLQRFGVVGIFAGGIGLGCYIVHWVIVRPIVKALVNDLYHAVVDSGTTVATKIDEQTKVIREDGDKTRAAFQVKCPAAGESNEDGN
jgi:hypothetical protein